MNQYKHIDDALNALCDNLPRTADEAQAWLKLASQARLALPVAYDGNARSRIAQSVGVVKAYWTDVTGLTWRQRQMQTGRTFGY